MLIIQVPKTSRVIEAIKDFYLTLYRQRLFSNARFKYSRAKAEQNIKNALAFIGMQLNDNALKQTINPRWKKMGLYEIRFKNWHLGVTVQLDMYGRNIALVQDCIHDKDYHNGTMETQPFIMDNPDDKSHLVDWKEQKIKTIIKEIIEQFIDKHCLKEIGDTPKGQYMLGRLSTRKRLNAKSINDYLDYGNLLDYTFKAQHGGPNMEKHRQKGGFDEYRRTMGF